MEISTFLIVVVGFGVEYAIGLILLAFFDDKIFAGLNRLRGKVRSLFGIEP